MAFSQCHWFINFVKKEVKIDLDSYLYRLKTGQIKEYKKIETSEKFEINVFK